MLYFYKITKGNLKYLLFPNASLTLNNWKQSVFHKAIDCKFSYPMSAGHKQTIKMLNIILPVEGANAFLIITIAQGCSHNPTIIIQLALKFLRLSFVWVFERKAYRRMLMAFKRYQNISRLVEMFMRDMMRLYISTTYLISALFISSLYQLGYSRLQQQTIIIQDLNCSKFIPYESAREYGGQGGGAHPCNSSACTSLCMRLQSEMISSPLNYNDRIKK